MSWERKVCGADSRPVERHEALELVTKTQAVAAAREVTPRHRVEAESANGAVVDSRNEVVANSRNGFQANSRTVAEAETGCGWHFCFNGSCVHHSRTAKWLLFWMCCAVFTLSMMVNGFMNVNVTTIEKRYQLKSKSSGLIISSWDIGSVSLVVPLSYIGSRPGTSKSRLLGTCVIIAGLGCYLATLPHFLVPPYETPRANESTPENTNLCRLKSPLKPEDFDSLEGDTDVPRSGTKKVSNFLYLFILASYITGLFSSPVFPVGASFIDESVSPEQSALYLAILLTAATIGPPIAFGLGGQLLKVFIDAPTVDPARFGLTPESYKWLGAWWIGYGITGTLCIIIGLNILMIPRVILRDQLSQGEEAGVAVKYAHKHMNPMRQRHSFVVLRSQPSAYHYLEEFLRASRALLCNVPFILLSLARAGEMFILVGLVPFMPKFMETQFGISAGLANLSMGLFGLLGGAMGTLVGGWLIKRFKMSCKSVLRFSFLVTLICVLSGASFLIRCPNKSFAGVTTAYSSDDYLRSPNITSSCNADCSCSDAPFSPVCGANDVIYFSPCHAGCTQSTKQNDQEIFSSCSCVDALRKPSASNESDGLLLLRPDQAVIDGCPSDCGMFVAFLSAHLVLFFLSVLTALPCINGTMRCVDFDLRAYAVGLQGLPLCLLGTVPGPIVFGEVVDKACLLWSEPSSGTGACLVYDNLAFGRYIFILSLAAKIGVVSCLFVAWRWYDEKPAQEPSESTAEECQCEPTSAQPPSKPKQTQNEGLAKGSLEHHSGHINHAFTFS